MLKDILDEADRLRRKTVIQRYIIALLLGVAVGLIWIRASQRLEIIKQEVRISMLLQEIERKDECFLKLVRRVK